jgi:hypothetical protein
MSMATDLPSRPAPSSAERVEVLDPTERVKSVADKADPRFKAALDRAEREQRLRERLARASSGDPAEEPRSGAPSVTQKASEAPEPAKKGTFSFNQTAGDTEDQR